MDTIYNYLLFTVDLIQNDKFIIINFEISKFKISNFENSKFEISNFEISMFEY